MISLLSRNSGKRQTLFQRDWDAKAPTSRESAYQIGNDPVWRFRADFKRRFFISTSEHGGLSVTALSTGALLWHLPKAEVKPYAHLEYQDGTAVWDASNSNDLEVWKTDIQSLPLGIFKRVAVLPHDCQIRGFQLSYDTLCVVSSEQKAFVYDMKHQPPQSVLQMKIDEGIVGHIDQNAGTMIICPGAQCYSIHDKTSGNLLGTLTPKNCRQFYHVYHPHQARNSIVSAGNSLSSLPSVEMYPPKQPNKHRFFPLDIWDDPMPSHADFVSTSTGSDQWGAAQFSGPMMVGYSRCGRLLICKDWRTAIQDAASFAKHSYILEFESDGRDANLGGWLSVHDKRIIFEMRRAGIGSLIYVIALEEDGNIRTYYDSTSKRPSYAFATSSATTMKNQVSFMALYDDCIVSTYTVSEPFHHPAHLVSLTITF